VCDCDVDNLCTQPDCILAREEEAARWYAIFEATPDPIAYTVEDLLADRVYDHHPYKYGDTHELA